MKIDALIIGAGPVGLTMAGELARFGLTVRIIDKAPAPTDKSKALVVWSRTLELLDRSGCAAKLLAAGRICTAANLMSGANKLAHITFDQVDSPHRYGLMIPQSETERVLAEHLATFGVTVERPTELLSFAQSEDFVTVTLSSGETIEASWLLACDGAHSTVRHQLQLPFTGDTLPIDWMLADVHIHGLADPAAMHICLHDAGPLAIFPIGEASSSAAPRFRIIASVGPTQPNRPDPTLADTQAVLDERGTGSLIASDPVWLANFTINERKVPDYRVDRVFLAGDAAHIHSPAGGQGMNTGMQDACNLAWKLALIQRGLCKSSTLLDSYTAERSPVAEQVLSATGKLTNLATITNPAMLALRNTAVRLALGFPPAREAMANELTELAVHYPESPLHAAASHGSPHPGDRAPIRPDELPIGSGDTPRFALFADPGPDADQFLACFPQILEPTPRPAVHPGHITLVRPDGYVALTAGVNDYPKADAYITHLIYAPTKLS